MINLMIVDDEPLVRLALRHMITSLDCGVEIVCEARDGMEALSLIKQRGDIDIIFVDIQMPRMNGIEFLRQLKEHHLPKPCFPIVLSAYNDYVYVREAFLLGAQDYMIKANMDKTYIAPILSKAVNEISKHKNEGDSKHESLSDYSGDYYIEKYEKLRLEYIVSTDPGEENLRYSALAELKEKLGETNITAVVIKVSRPKSDERTIGFIRQTILTVIESMSIHYEIVYKEPGEYILFIALPQYRSVMAAHEKIHSALTTVKIRLKQFVNVSVAIGISDWGRDSQQWSQMVKQAFYLANWSYYKGYDKLYFPESVSISFQDHNGHGECVSYIKDLQQSRSLLVKALNEIDATHWKLQYGNFCSLLEQADRLRPNVVKSEFVDIVWEIGGLLYTKGLRWEQLQEGFSNPLEFISQFETMETTLHWMKEVLVNIHGLFHHKETKSQVNFSLPIAKAKVFLDEHFCEDINLPVISKLVGVSESYLSKQFAKEVGSNFIQYLTKLRIEEAKRLMMKGMKVSDVAEKVGYLNPEHFSRTFKKATGYSPKTHRENV